MPGSPYFVQRCPSCCRLLRIDVHYLGIQVVCQHCEKGFVARDSSLEPAAMMDPISYWIQQADHQLGEQAATPQPSLAFRPR